MRYNSALCGAAGICRKIADGDWAEDVDGLGSYTRSGDPAHFDGDAGHTVNGYYHNNMWHKDDTFNATGDIHDYGNIMDVAFYLLAMGGHNPVFDIHPNLIGSGTVLTGLGVSEAARILLDDVWFHSYPSEGWVDVANGAIVAAHDDYYPATVEQDQVIKAFASIGYRPTIGPF